MKNSIKLFILLCITGCINTNKNIDTSFELELGDILFQDLDSDPLCDAIELVTPGYKEANLSHIGIVSELEDPYCINANYNNDIRILEAIPNKVKTTRLDSFLQRSFDNNNNPKVIVGRLKPEHRHTIHNAIIFLKSKLNIEYDNEFLIDNNKYYCSELIYNAFKKDNIFKLEPMTFLDPESNDTLQAWLNYYKELGVKIPQNELGINPGIMSLSEKIEIVHTYGIPDGMKK